MWIAGHWIRRWLNMTSTYACFNSLSPSDAYIVSKQTTTGSDNGLSPGRRQAIIWIIAGILLFGPSGTNFSEILIAIHTFSFKKTFENFICKCNTWWHNGYGFNYITHPDPHFICGVTHWDKMVAIFQTTFENAFSWMKTYEFQLRFHCIPS